MFKSLLMVNMFGYYYISDMAPHVENITPSDPTLAGYFHLAGVTQSRGLVERPSLFLLTIN